MFGRRLLHHHAQALSARRVAATLAVLAAACCLAAYAGADERISPEGVVHSVGTGLGQSGGIAIEYTRQLPSGEIQVELLPGTDDYPTDRDPTLDLRPDGEPIVAWLRNEGPGPQLYVSRRSAAGWTELRTLFPSAKEKHAPALAATGEWVTVTWRELSPLGVQFYRGVIDAATLDPVYGPEAMSLGREVPPVPPTGESVPGTTPEPPVGDVAFFASLLPPEALGDPSRAIVWGIQDEPIPIDYCQRFILPDDAGGAHDFRASSVAGRLTLTFVAGDRLFYTTRRGGMWTDLRVVQLDEETSAAEARLAVFEMIQREAAAP